MDISTHSNQLFSKMTGINILVVEDNQVNQMVARLVLDRYNCHVTVAEDGVMALNMISEQQFDLVLMDLRIPKMNGFEVTEVIRQRESNGYASMHLPIIAMTGSALVEENLKCFCVGMDDFISKPFEPDDLMRKIIKHLN